jgi:hypothetical protein
MDTDFNEHAYYLGFHDGFNGPLTIVAIKREYAYYLGFHDGVCGNDKQTDEYQEDYNRGYAIGVTHQPEGE